MTRCDAGAVDPREGAEGTVLPPERYGSGCVSRCGAPVEKVRFRVRFGCGRGGCVAPSYSLGFPLRCSARSPCPKTQGWHQNSSSWGQFHNQSLMGHQRLEAEKANACRFVCSDLKPTCAYAVNYKCDGPSLTPIRLRDVAKPGPVVGPVDRGSGETSDARRGHGQKHPTQPPQEADLRQQGTHHVYR